MRLVIAGWSWPLVVFLAGVATFARASPERETQHPREKQSHIPTSVDPTAGRKGATEEKSRKAEQNGTPHPGSESPHGNKSATPVHDKIKNHTPPPHPRHKGVLSVGQMPSVPVNTVTSFAELKRLRKTDRGSLHVLVTSNNRRGLSSLQVRPASVNVLPHAMAQSISEAESVHGGANAAGVPVAHITRFVAELPNAGRIDTSSKLTDSLLQAARNQPAGAAVLVPGHVEGKRLVLRDGSRVPIQEISDANRQAVFVFVGCNTCTVEVTGKAVVGTVGAIEYRQATRDINFMLEQLPRTSLAAVLYHFQEYGGMYAALVGGAIALFPQGRDDDEFLQNE